MDRVNLAEKFGQFDDAWNPRVVAELNGASRSRWSSSGASSSGPELDGYWHEHEAELFWVVRGRLCLRFRDREVRLGEGEFMVVPRGVEHLPVAETEEVWAVLFEPTSTLNTGNLRGERTREALEQL